MYPHGYFAGHTVVYQPLALMVWPVMKLAASETRNATTDAISSGTAIRRNGFTFAILARISSERHRRCPPLHMLLGPISSSDLGMVVRWSVNPPRRRHCSARTPIRWCTKYWPWTARLSAACTKRA
jgi:hypothetical protein